MTYYEELGVPPDATPETIREAYRNVARLLHPDAQTNPTLKESAEAQMKRINHLYETLSDPERRRRYDQDLAEPAERASPIIIQAPAAPELQPRNPGLLVWLGATGICAIFVLWLATRESSVPAVYPAYTASQGAGAAATVPAKSAADRMRDEIARLRAELSAVYADRDRLQKQIAAMETGRKFQLPVEDTARAAAPLRSLVNVTPTPLAAQSSTVQNPLPIALARAEPPKPHWSGSWKYTASPNNHRNKALFPPEFIETVISEENGWIKGQYHGRFKVNDPKILPEVNFRFEGWISGPNGRLPWTGDGDAKGEVQLRLVSDSTLEVVWSASDLGKSMGLASGIAVLNRR
jgi:curved DNA-binding protein CbpA